MQKALLFASLPYNELSPWRARTYEGHHHRVALGVIFRPRGYVSSSGLYLVLGVIPRPRGYISPLGLYLTLGVELYALDAYAAKKLDALLRAVGVGIYHTLDTCLNNQLCALYAGRCRNVERRAVAVVSALGYLRDGVCLGVKHVGLGLAHIVLADILEARRSAVIAVRDNHLILDKQRSHLAAYAVGVLCPYASHLQVANVELSLFLLLISHTPML